jgi:hypothetical protein
MYVKELIKCLKRCNPDAEVRFEEPSVPGTLHVDAVFQEQEFGTDGDDDLLCVLRCDNDSYHAWCKRNGYYPASKDASEDGE